MRPSFADFKNTITIAVLRGGWSSEREISLKSGAGIIQALENCGFTVIDVIVERDLSKLLQQLTPKPDIAYNTLHGIGGEDGVMQGVLEMLDIKQVQSGITASAIAIDKALTRRLFQQVNLPMPKGVLTTQKSLLENPPIPLPYVAKRPKEGSSVGVYIIKEGKPDIQPDDSPILVEEFIEGREFSIPVLHDQALPIVEIMAQDGLYDFYAKYDDTSPTKYQTPANLPQDITQKMQGYAVQAHQCLGCKGLTRTDFMLDHQDNIYLLEINTHPGMTSHSLAPLSAKAAGMSFEDLVEKIVNN